MENTTTVSSLDTIIGTTYIVEAIIIIPLHVLCMYLMLTDKEMETATYAFMVNLSIADCAELLVIGVYTGTVILTKWEISIMDRFATFIICTAFYTGCVIFVFISFSRWIALTRPHLDKIVFKYVVYS